MKKDVLSPEKLLPYSQKDNHVVYSLINPRKCLSSKAKSKIIFWQFQACQVKRKRELEMKAKIKPCEAEPHVWFDEETLKMGMADIL